MPRINCYAFSTSINPIHDVATRVAGTLQCQVADLNYCESGENAVERSKACWGVIVRDVSPKKVMVCLSFVLPSKVAEADPIVFSTKRSIEGDGHIGLKKLKHS